MAHVTKGLSGNQTRSLSQSSPFCQELCNQSAIGHWKSNNEGTSDQLFSEWESWARVAATPLTKCHWFGNGGYIGFIPPSGNNSSISVGLLSPLPEYCAGSTSMLPALYIPEDVWNMCDNENRSSRWLSWTASLHPAAVTWPIILRAAILPQTPLLFDRGGGRLNCPPPQLRTAPDFCILWSWRHVVCSTIILWAILVPFRLLDAIQSADYHL